jgi:ubiquinone/menaquinone biosynthesis C-methylase UbiE
MSMETETGAPVLTPESVKGSWGQKFRNAILEQFWEGGQVATESYKRKLAQLVQPRMRLLHAGCGWDRNNVSRPYQESCEIVGIDLDQRVQSMFHSQFHLASLADLPFEDEHFDVVFSEYVMEHVEDPDSAYREISRVLKPGGRAVILTPNLFSYKSLVAAFTPQWFHIWMGRIRYGRGHEADMYPTCFQCNTLRRFEYFSKKHGLKLIQVEFVTNGPTWFSKFPVLFEFFHLYHLIIQRLALFCQLRCALIVEMEKI